MNVRFNTIESKEDAIRTIYAANGFDFSETEWDDFASSGYSKLDVAKICCEHAVLADIDCYNRYVIAAWNGGPKESLVQALLDERYEQWVDVEHHPELEDVCCEEWMIDGLTGFGKFHFSIIYGVYDK